MRQKDVLAAKLERKTKFWLCRPRQNVRVCSGKRGRDSFFKDDFFQEGKDSLNDAKQLFAQGEKMFQRGQFQQGQRLFKQAEQQLRQAKQQMPMQPFKTSNMDFQIPKIKMGGADPSWKTSSLAILAVGAIATLVAGELPSFMSSVTLDHKLRSAQGT